MVNQRINGRKAEKPLTQEWKYRSMNFSFCPSFLLSLSLSIFHFLCPYSLHLSFIFIFPLLLFPAFYSFFLLFILPFLASSLVPLLALYPSFDPFYAFIFLPFYPCVLLSFFILPCIPPFSLGSSLNFFYPFFVPCFFIHPSLIACCFLSFFLLPRSLLSSLLLFSSFLPCFLSFSCLLVLILPSFQLY